MLDHYILVKKKPVKASMIEWAVWFENGDRRICFDQFLGDEIKVSTVFLGLDHNFSGGDPVLFESMVFGGFMDEYQDRYSTYKEAEEGHKNIIHKIFDNALEERNWDLVDEIKRKFPKIAK